MIVHFTIQNFGSIKEQQTLSFEADKSKHLDDQYVIQTTGGLRLLKLALIYGANASGKSTVLKALDFLRTLVLEPANKKNDELNFNPFLFNKNTPGQHSVLSIEFIQNEVKYQYEVTFYKKAIVSEELYFFNPHKANVYRRSTDLKNQFTEIAFGSKIKKEKSIEKGLAANTLWNNTVLGGYLKTNIEQHELKEVVDWFNTYLHPLIGSRTKLKHFIIDKIEKSDVKKKDIINILKKADFNISDLTIDATKGMPSGMERFFKALNYTDEQIKDMKNNPPKKIQFAHRVNGKAYYLPIELESEGTKRYFEFAGLLCLLMKRPVAVPIDELESSLHPELFIHFILSFLLNSGKSQMIATTHNREILDNKDIFRNDVIWFTDKPASCATELYSLADFDSSIVRDTSNVLNAYKSGKLKGVPNLGDYYIELSQ